VVEAGVSLIEAFLQPHAAKSEGNETDYEHNYHDNPFPVGGDPVSLASIIDLFFGFKATHQLFPDCPFAERVELSDVSVGTLVAVVVAEPVVVPAEVGAEVVAEVVEVVVEVKVEVYPPLQYPLNHWTSRFWLVASVQV
jgi:hypothetical protein